MNDKNKRPAAGIGALLQKPHFGGNTTGVLPPDPAIPTRILATLDDVIAYKDNPRQSRNPLYDEIKESIRNRGLDHAPNVTRKNPADPYMIKDGGNTRLEILRELWEETGDEKFYRLDLMFHPWTNDLDVLVGHMIENEMRGNMIFIERAIAARRIKEQLEADGGNPPKSPAKRPLGGFPNRRKRNQGKLKLTCKTSLWPCSCQRCGHALSKIQHARYIPQVLGLWL
jgi:hypothetical protein